MSDGPFLEAVKAVPHSVRCEAGLSEGLMCYCDHLERIARGAKAAIRLARTMDGHHSMEDPFMCECGVDIMQTPHHFEDLVVAAFITGSRCEDNRAKS